MFTPCLCRKKVVYVYAMPTKVISFRVDTDVYRYFDAMREALEKSRGCKVSFKELFCEVVYALNTQGFYIPDEKLWEEIRDKLENNLPCKGL